MILVCYRSPDLNPNPFVSSTLHDNLKKRYGCDKIEGIHTIGSSKWLFVDLTTSKGMLTSDSLTSIHYSDLNNGGITQILVGSEIRLDDIAYLRGKLLRTPICFDIRLTSKLFDI